MIDLTKLPPEDAERIAHAEGFTGVAAMFARISDLEHGLELLIDALDSKSPLKIARTTWEVKELLP
jgi:hypothetical protein